MAMPAATGIESPSMLIGPTITGSTTPAAGKLTMWMFRSRPREFDELVLPFLREAV